ncbi:MAG: hypothetical protein M3Q79_00200 [bacterium]|nr:hypothetical protein [bacterium]
MLVLLGVPITFADQPFTIERVSTDSAGGQVTSYWEMPLLSGSGRYLVFDSSTTNLVAGDTNSAEDVFRKDLATGAIELVSTSASGVQGNANSFKPSISVDGRFVAFHSTASNLVAVDTNGADQDIFLKDMQTGLVKLVSSNSSGVQANGPSDTRSGVSDDGRYVVFDSLGTNLIASDTNGTYDVFLKDTVTGVTSLVSASASGVQDNSGAIEPTISGDGIYVAFTSFADNLVPGYTNNGGEIFVKNIQTGAIQMASTSSSGGQPNNYSYFPKLAAGGQFVAFQSEATNLVTGDTNATTDIYIKDLQTGIIRLVSADAGGTIGNGSSQTVNIAVSADGQYVTFNSLATNLVTGDTNGLLDTFVKNTVSGEIVRLSVDVNGIQGNGNSFYTSISADGKYALLSSGATTLVPGDTNSISDLFLTANPLWDAPVVPDPDSEDSSALNGDGDQLADTGMSQTLILLLAVTIITASGFMLSRIRLKS